MPRLRSAPAIHSLILLFLVLASGASPAGLAEEVSPGGTIDFLAPDSCSTKLEIPNSVESLARAHASCSAGSRRLRRH